MSLNKLWLAQVSGLVRDDNGRLHFRAIAKLISKEDETTAKAYAHGLYVQEYPGFEIIDISLTEETKKVREWVSDNPTYH
jgi:hypothetical protein